LLTASNKKLTQLWISAHELNILAQKLHCNLLMDYKFILPKYDINNKKFVGLDTCATEK